MKYKIVRGKNIPDLEVTVNKAIAEGWTPQGGAMIVGMVYAQAMVRAE